MVASIQRAYEDLPPDAARVFLRLGLLPATRIDAHLVAAVCEIPHPQAVDAMGTLVAAHLLQDSQADAGHNGPLEYVIPEVAAQAAGELAAGRPQTEREEVLRRWTEWLLLISTQAEARLSPSHRKPPRTPRCITQGPDLFDGAGDQNVVEWLERHRSDLVCAVDTAYAAGWYDLTWQVVDAMWPLFLRRGHTEATVALHEERGLPAAERGGDPTVVRRMLTTLGGGLRSLGRYDAALDRYKQALDSAWQDKNRLDEAQALDGIGEVLRQAGRTGEAIPALRRALTLREKIGYVRGAALTRFRLGEIAAERDDLHGAIRLLAQARSELLAEGDGYDAARALATIGRIYTHAQHYTEALRHLRAAEDEFRATGSSHWQAHTREWAGLALQAAGRLDEARTHLTDARAMYAALPSTRDTGRLEEHLRSLGTTASA